MIIWINGAFGAGKTTCAYELGRRLPESFVYDPENVGYFIRQNTPKRLHEEDFQCHVQWRQFNYEMLKYLSDSYEGTVITPMTLVNPQYYEEIIGRLRGDGVQIKHFILYAEKKTIEKRLKKRFELGNTWGREQIDRCIYAFDHIITEEKIRTDGRTVDQIVEEIAQKSNLFLPQDKRGILKKWVDRWNTFLRNIR